MSDNYRRPNKIADCEVCGKEQVEVWNMHGNILMCVDCRKLEQAAVEQAAAANQMIQESRAVDSSITMKADVFLAKTVAAVELKGAIDADPNIPAHEKEYVYAKECYTRFQNLQKVIFEDRQALLEKENELRMWQVNTQTAAGKLRQELRNQFKELDVNYQPAPITKKQKTTKPVSAVSKKKFSKTELYDAAQKYNLANHVPQIQQIAIAKNMTAEQAAKHLAGLLGL